MANKSEPPFVPPLRKPVSEFPTPDPSVAFYTELVNRDDPAYYANAPMKRGQLYSTIVGAKQEVISTYPQLFFLRERKFQLNDQLVLWDWATDEQAHDTYNSTDTYVQNSVNYPAYTRTYTVRRELYEAEPTIPIGSPLPGIIAVTVTNPGGDYTVATGSIPGTSVAIEFTISPNGNLLNGIITNTGDQIVTNGTDIVIDGDGMGATATAVSQPVGCVLTAQTKKEQDDQDPIQHELVEVIRVYETLPGPWIYTTEMDKDGAVVTVQTRRQVKDFITDKDEILNGQWIQRFHKDVDDFIAEEMISSRVLPGNPIVDTKVDEDGMILTTTMTLVDASTVTSTETLLGGVWTKTFKEQVDHSTLIKVHQASNLVCWQMSEARPIPGNAIPSTKLDKDGHSISVARTMKDKTLITTAETVGGGVWTRTSSEQISDLVSWEIVEARVVPGTAVPSANIAGDMETETIATTLKQASMITPGAIEGAGIITSTEQKEVTDLVSEEVVKTKHWLDTAFYSVSVINLIPREFMASIQTVVTSHVSAGTAALPTLGFLELERSQRQLDKLLMETRVTTLGNLSLPITHTNQETTEEFGGGILNVNYTLDVLGFQTIDSGYLVVSSTLTDLGNGGVVKETKQNSDVAWPVLLSSLWDPEQRQNYLRSTQIVPVGTGPDVNPGYFGFISEVTEVDEWRSKKINIGKSTPAYTDSASALITYEIAPFRFPGLLYTASGGYYTRSADARLVQHTIRTWWQSSVSAPVISFTQIIMDNPIISTLNNNTLLMYAGPCIHDDLYTFNAFFFPGTTPTFTQYTGQIVGTGTLGFTAGSPNVAGTGTAFTTDLAVGDVFGVYNAIGTFAIQSITNDGALVLDSNFPFTFSGFPVIFNRPSIAWVGSERVIGVSVTQEKEQNIWKIQTQSVVMR